MQEMMRELVLACSEFAKREPPNPYTTQNDNSTVHALKHADASKFDSEQQKVQETET